MNRSILGSIYMWLFALLIGIGMINAYILIHRPDLKELSWILLIFTVTMPVAMSLFVGLIWDDRSIPSGIRESFMFWPVLAAVFLVIIILGWMTGPMEEGVLMTGGIILWNLLVPIGRLIGRKLWWSKG